ncbi:MAG TPA: endonuclease III [archaeon]|nr:endonuclease III [archaeon]
MDNVLLIVKELRRHSTKQPVVGFKDPFKVLISTVLSQRTRDENTEKASRQLFVKYPNAKALAHAQLGSIKKLIKPAGFYRVKAKRIKKISLELLEKFSGKVPRKKEDLLQLNGVGPKTAACVIVYGFKKPDLPVDTHVFRISHRLAIAKSKTPEQTESELKKFFPKKYWIEINHLMVQFGQKICLPRNPRCEICGLKKICAYYKIVVMEKRN